MSADTKEAIDLMEILPENPPENNPKVSDDGRICRIVSDSKFTLYKSNAGYDALRVDTFKISVFCYGKCFYGIF